jgi:molybdopterin-containing oxidoreductase family iron-sulfur binding subunit
MVMVGPRLSLTAANADEWIPVRPGHELDLALSIAAVLFDKGLASGNGHEPFRELCLSRAKPATVAERTGVPLKRIERVASELAEHRPSVALAGGSSLRSERGVALALAVSHLNALLGAYSEGGLLRAETSIPGFATNTGNARVLAAELASGHPLPPVLFVSDTNPLFSLPSGFKLGERLDGTFLVSFASFPDETMQMADLVLPESMSFERFEEALPDFGLAPLARLSGPLLLRPIYDTRSMPDVLIALAERLGFSAHASGTYENSLRERWSSLGAWDDLLARGFFAGARETAKPPIEYRFATEPIERAIGGEGAANEPGLALHLYPSTAFGDGRGARLPYLQDLADPVTGIRWGSVLEIAESDARRIGVRTGDRIELRAGERSVEAPAFVSQGIVPGVVALAVGQGHTANGRHADGRGVNAYSLLAPAVDEDGFLLTAEKVEIQKLL